MTSSKAIFRKLQYEIKSIAALGKFYVKKNSLLEQMSVSMPMLSIEPTNICNANCTFCAYQYQERPTGIMSMEFFKKVVDEYCECGGGPLGMTPTVGEPFVDPHLIERITYARACPEITTIGIYSNMISLDRVGADALVNSGLDYLTVSTSGFDAEMYERVYRSTRYTQVIANILDFAETNNAAGRPVDYKIDMRIDRPWEEVIATADYARVAEAVGEENIIHKFRYDSWAGKIEEADLSGNMKLRKPNALRRPRISPCSELYSGPMVYWDGRVGACGCRDVNASELIIGDANKEHLASIWMGNKLRQIREEFLTDKVRDICKQCTHYNNLSHLLRPDAAEAFESITRPIKVDPTVIAKS
ncbi:MAG: MoaA/NifB/PqqE/SkfB family radical SAM enzyme [Planctomycetota bacterium]|jgi:MoaA/NifB/PqqE/SkfB family radical SAM enzyme